MTRLFREMSTEAITQLVNFFEIESVEGVDLFNGLIDAFALYHVRSIMLIGIELGVI